MFKSDLQFSFYEQSQNNYTNKDCKIDTIINPQKMSIARSEGNIPSDKITPKLIYASPILSKQSTSYKLANRVKIENCIENQKFYRKTEKNLSLIMKELEKLKDSFTRYKGTIGFRYLYNKIESYE